MFKVITSFLALINFICALYILCFAQYPTEKDYKQAAGCGLVAIILTVNAGFMGLNEKKDEE